MKTADIFGWSGVLAIIVAFSLNIFQTIQSDSYLYLALNVYGSLGIIISSSIKKDFQPVVLNAWWLIILRGNTTGDNPWMRAVAVGGAAREEEDTTGESPWSFISLVSLIRIWL